MIKKSPQMNRQTFMTQTACGISAAALSSVISPFIKTVHTKTKPKTIKKLFATTDYEDNVLVNNSFMDKKQLNDLHKILAALGVTRHQWIVSPYWTFYEEYLHGFDLLAEAVKSAHAHGIELYALLKTFEDGGVRTILPHTMPFPKDVVAFKDICGISPWAHPFAARHPEMSLKRKSGTYEFKGPVKSIRLVKDSHEPTRVKAEHLSVWTSTTNNRFEKYDGPVSFRESVEWRLCFPKWKQCRVLHLEDLNLPKKHTYILIRCSLADQNGDFSNEIGKIIEPVGPDNENIPFIQSEGPVTLAEHQKDLLRHNFRKQYIHYLQLPEVQNEIDNPTKMRAHYQNFYKFDEYYKITNRKTFDRDGFIAIACGKQEYMLGNLNPIYPEVREHWLDITRFCLDRNVDGINYRMANHTTSPDYWDYGFNEPVLKASNGHTDYVTISKINGNAYTEFLRLARTLIKSKGKNLTLHLHAGMLMPDERGENRNSLPSLPPNIEWQWETWVREIADDLEFRGAFKLRPWNLEKVLDTFSAATRAAKKPLYFQSDFHSYPNDEGRKYAKQNEIELVTKHPGLDGFVLYETANYTQLNKNDDIEIKPYIDDVIRTKYRLQ